MYSVVLATMLSAGSTTPEFCWHHSCHSCYSSCYCSSCYSCYSGYAGYAGYCSCSCYSSCHHIFPIFHHHSYCHCSCSTVYYSSCCSCYSSCTTYYSPCCGGVIYGPQVMPVPPAKGSEKVAPPVKDKGKGDQASARVTVNLPSDAKLWVDAVECPLTSSVRSFNTPALNPGQRYVYNIKAEIVRDGRTISETQRVVLTPGEESRVDFNSNGGAIAAAATSNATASR